jgi:hypothetical protein
MPKYDRPTTIKTVITTIKEALATIPRPAPPGK